MTQQKQQNEFKAVIPVEVTQTRYGNLVQISSSPDEFVFDFFHLFPPAQTAVLQTRISLSPRVAKSFLKALRENVEKYEAKCGEIKNPEEPTPKVGFQVP